MSNKTGIVREGWLKRVKNQKRRYFVLGFNKETGIAQLQYYENEKKFHSEAEPKRTISLQQCLGIITKVDEKFGKILVLYTRKDVFSVKADTDQLLEDWLMDLDKLLKMEYKNLQELKYDFVWNVKVIARGLGGVKNVTGSYQLCLKDNVLSFINPVSQEVVIEEKLYHVRRFGYMEYCVFMEFGRSTALGPGEIWMEVEDPLIAQKIEDTLARAAKPGGKQRPGRFSMVENSSNYIRELTAGVDNNNDSPKTRRGTLIKHVFGKKKEKDVVRPHAYTVSAISHPTFDGRPIGDKFRHLNLNNTPHAAPKQADEGDSEEEHYPHVAPPVLSTAGSSAEDVDFKFWQTGSAELETKSLGGVSSASATSNEFARNKPKKRSIVKQDVRAVRGEYIREKLRTTSLPRRASSSSSSDPSFRRSLCSDQNVPIDKNDDSDEDVARESDNDGENTFFQSTDSAYLKMNPRKAIASDSSVEDAGTYVPNLGIPESYVHMSSPRLMRNAEKSRHVSVRSSDSYCSNDELGDHEPDGSPYVNMSPGQGVRRSHASSSSSSEDAATADTGGERFDHLNRGVKVKVSSGSLLSDHSQCYVNMSPRSVMNGKLRKSRSETQASTPAAYVNMDVSRSQSVGHRTARHKPKFHIVSEERSVGNEGRGLPNSYVNVKANGIEQELEPSANYANLVPQRQTQSHENSPEKKSHPLNYTSVEFLRNDPSGKRDQSFRQSHHSKNQANYSKIDFEKSEVLADMSSSRERQLHHGI